MSQPNLSISNFKAFLLKVLLPVCALLGGVSFSFAYLVEKNIILGANTTGAYKVNRIITETHLKEIPILGSSRAEGSYVPEILGENYFNYGLSGAGSSIMLFFLNEECNKKEKKTPIIINFDLNAITYSRGDISNYLLNANYPPLRQILGEDYRFYYQIPVLKYYGTYEYYLKNYLNDKTHLTKYTNNGAVIETNVMTPQKFQELVKQRESDTTIFVKSPELVDKLYSIIRQNPQRLFIMVVAPYHQSCFNHFPNLSEPKAILQDLDKMENVKVYDFSQLNYPDSLFVNTTHLNYQGACLFSETLKDSLTTLKIPTK